MTKKKLREQIQELTRQLRLIVASPGSMEAQVVISSVKGEIDFEKSILSGNQSNDDLIKKFNFIPHSIKDYLTKSECNNFEHFESRELGRKYPVAQEPATESISVDIDSLSELSWVPLIDYYENKAEWPEIGTKVRYDNFPLIGTKIEAIDVRWISELQVMEKTGILKDTLIDFHIEVLV